MKIIMILFSIELERQIYFLVQFSQRKTYGTVLNNHELEEYYLINKLSGSLLL
jgi:hypothetical protein